MYLVVTIVFNNVVLLMVGDNNVVLLMVGDVLIVFKDAYKGRVCVHACV